MKSSVMALIKISSFSMCKVCEVTFLVILCLWFITSFMEEAVYGGDEDETGFSSRLFQSNHKNDKKRNFTCYNDDDPFSRKLFPDKILKDRGCEQRLPSVLVSGVKYCTTDLLTSILRHHPYLVFPKTRDVSYFSDFYDMGIKWYRRQMGFSIREQMNVDSSSSYFTHNLAPERISRELLDEVKVIVLFCDPVVRALRESKDIKVSQEELLKDMVVELEDGQTTEDHDIWGWSTSDLGGSSSNPVVINGLYINFLPTWYKYLPEENFFMLGEERLFNNTEEVLVRIEKFLKLPSFYESKIFRDPFLDVICLRTYDFNPFCFSQKKSEKAVAVAKTATEVQELQKFYEPYNQKLQKLFLVPVL